MDMKPYSERIPAALAKGEAFLGKRRVRWIPVANDYLTVGELALADWAWETMCFEQMKLYGGLMQALPAALIAFCEKMEALDD